MKKRIRNVKRRPVLEGFDRPLLFAHRGYSRRAPENTLSAFKAAREAGIPGVELDIHLCKSGELVVVHDHNLQRTAGTDAVVEQMPYEAIKELDAGSWFSPEFAGERVPLLSEVFELLGTHVYYDIEIKHKVRGPAPAAPLLAELIRKHNLTERCLVSSFNPFALRTFRRATRLIPTALIYASDHSVPYMLRGGRGRYLVRPDALKPSHEHLNRARRFLIRALGTGTVIVWTVDDPELAVKLTRNRVHGIISNDPGPIQQALR